MRIGFFGGTFDPPHNGHLAVARAAADAFALDRVLLAPVASQPLKPQGAEASFEQRLEMVSLLCAADPRLEPSALDAPRIDGLPNYTVDTLARLRETLPAAAQLFVITGTDAFRGIGSWHKPERLLTQADWIVVSRPSVPPVLPQEARFARRDGRIHLLTDIAEPASATEVRARLQYGLPCDHLVPGPVLAYMLANGLYQAARRR